MSILVTVLALVFVFWLGAKENLPLCVAGWEVIQHLFWILRKIALVIFLLSRLLLLISWPVLWAIGSPFRWLDANTPAIPQE